MSRLCQHTHTHTPPPPTPDAPLLQVMIDQLETLACAGDSLSIERSRLDRG